MDRSISVDVTAGGSASTSAWRDAHRREAAAQTAQKISLMIRGAVFTKFGRKGSPRLRFVCLSQDLQTILIYRKINRSIKKTRDCRHIPVSSVVQVMPGCKTETWKSSKRN